MGKKGDDGNDEEVLAIPIVQTPADLPLSGPITFAALRKHSEKFSITVQPDEMGQLIVQSVYPRNIDEADKVGEVKKEKNFVKKCEKVCTVVLCVHCAVIPSGIPGCSCSRPHLPESPAPQRTLNTKHVHQNFLFFLQMQVVNADIQNEFDDTNILDHAENDDNEGATQEAAATLVTLQDTEVPTQMQQKERIQSAQEVVAALMDDDGTGVDDDDDDDDNESVYDANGEKVTTFDLTQQERDALLGVQPSDFEDDDEVDLAATISPELSQEANPQPILVNKMYKRADAILEANKPKVIFFFFDEHVLYSMFVAVRDFPEDEVGNSCIRECHLGSPHNERTKQRCKFFHTFSQIFFPAKKETNCTTTMRVDLISRLGRH